VITATVMSYDLQRRLAKGAGLVHGEAVLKLGERNHHGPLFRRQIHRIDFALDAFFGGFHTALLLSTGDQ
jgi:hypothetical protein